MNEKISRTMLEEPHSPSFEYEYMYVCNVYAPSLLCKIEISAHMGRYGFDIYNNNDKYDSCFHSSGINYDYNNPDIALAEAKKWIVENYKKFKKEKT